MVNCRDVQCSNESHKVACDEHMLEMLGCIEKAANECLPFKVGNRHKNVIPRWNHDIKQFQEDAHFWHSIWQSAGRPLNCELHSLMKKTRNLYHLHIRKNKRMLDNIKRNIVALMVREIYLTKLRNLGKVSQPLPLQLTMSLTTYQGTLQQFTKTCVTALMTTIT